MTVLLVNSSLDAASQTSEGFCAPYSGVGEWLADAGHFSTYRPAVAQDGRRAQYLARRTRDHSFVRADS